MKKSVVFAVLILLILTACVFVGCVPTGGKVIENPDMILSGVKQISLSEYKREYWLGENLDLSNAVLKILLDTGEIRTIDPNNSKTVSISGYNRFQRGKQTVTVQYGGKFSSTFEVNVEMPKIKNIALKSYPTKTDYVIGDRLDMTGAVITVFMENGTDVDFTVDSSIVSGSSAKLDVNKEFTNTGENLELNIRYGTMTIPFYVNVAPSALTGISIAEWPTKKSYYLGETLFDPTGLKLNYTFDNGKTETVDAEAQSNLRYVFDFGTASNQSPVKVQYVENDEVLFEAKFTVIVNKARYVSLSVIRNPEGAMDLIEGFSEIDFSTGMVTVKFDDGSTLDLPMNDPAITTSKYDNRIVGAQNVNVYYMNNQNNFGVFTVITKPKSAASVVLSGVEDMKNVSYYEGQNAKISIAKLYYTVRYNNGTTGEKTPMSETMLAEGSDLFCYGDNGRNGIKTICFIVEGIEVRVKLEIIPKAVKNVEIETTPSNGFVLQNGTPNPAGGVVIAAYNNGTNEKISMTDTRVNVECDTSATVGSTVAVKVFVGEITDSAPYDSYFVTIVERLAQSVTLKAEPKKTTGYVYGDPVDFTGLKLEIGFADGKTTVLTASGSKVENGISYVTFQADGGKEESVAVSVLLNGRSNEFSVSADVYVYYYGVSADKSFRVTVEERSVNGITVVDTDNVALVMIVGQDYDSVAGLVVKVAYTTGGVETKLTNENAKRISKNSEISEEGFYWYTEGSTEEEGTLTVTVVFAFRNQSGVIATYPCSYSVNYRSAALRYIAGIYSLKSGSPEAVDSLGSQPRGLTPYLMDYYVGCYYEDDTLKYIPLTVSMTDYDVKNLTIGKRPVRITYAGQTFETSILVTDESVRSIAIGKEPRKNYVFTENLSLVGGTIIRTFDTDGEEKKDTVDMGEASVRLLNAWPTSVADFHGAEKITVTVELSYEKVAPVTFTVDVYQPIDLNPTIVNTQNYYGNISNPSVSLGEPLAGFTLPNYTVRYATDADGINLLDGIPTADADGNTIYPTPKTVGKFYVVVTSEGNRYYNLPKKVDEFVISPLAITLKPNYVSKIYGMEDPLFTYTASNESLWRESMYDKDGNPLWKGCFIRETGEDAGEYAISEDPNNRFEHPYFVISVESAGTLTIRPATIRLELTPSVLFYEKDEDGNAVNQKNNIDFRFAFITVAPNGFETSVTEDEIEANQGNPAYAVYDCYLTELRTDGRRYRWKVEVRGVDGNYSNDLPVDKLGDYFLKISLMCASTQAENFLLYDKDNPSVGQKFAYHKISVLAKPYAAPIVGSTTLRLDTEETSIEALEKLVAEEERVSGLSYDFVATDNYVYLWKYRDSVSQREQYPEGKYLAYNTTRLGNQWLAEGSGVGAGGFRISREHLAFDANGAIIRLKFFGNGDDRAESQQVSTVIPNVYAEG